MCFGKAFLLASVFVTVPLSGQTNTVTPFVAQVLAKYAPLLTLHSITLSGGAQWTAGALHESGTASLEAGVDGSSSLQLSVGSASRTETRTAFGSSRTCQWTDAQGVIHNLIGPDCDATAQWFAPILLLEPPAAISTLLSISDDGLVTRNGSSYRQLSYFITEQTSDSTTTNLLTADTKVSVLYDPQTLLPASVEYAVHADTDLNTSLRVRVVYSNYRTVSGLPIPFQIDRYINNALQLSVTINNASIN